MIEMKADGFFNNSFHPNVCTSLEKPSIIFFTSRIFSSWSSPTGFVQLQDDDLPMTPDES